jgi:hypothetical protein
LLVGEITQVLLGYLTDRPIEVPLVIMAPDFFIFFDEGVVKQMLEH